MFLMFFFFRFFFFKEEWEGEGVEVTSMYDKTATVAAQISLAAVSPSGFSV